MARDLSFIGRPHEYDARRVFSLTRADWQDRINFGPAPQGPAGEEEMLK